MTTLDERDTAILDRKLTRLNSKPGPRVGDFVRFKDGVERRISYIWDGCPGTPVQTSPSGSYYLGEGDVSMSGGLCSGVPMDTLTLTPHLKGGTVWFFHHDERTAHNATETRISFRVYDCTEEAPS